MPNASFKPSPNGKPPEPGDAEIASRIAKYERREAKLIAAAAVFAAARRLTQ